MVSNLPFKRNVVDVRCFPAAEACLAGGADVPRRESRLRAANSSCAVSLVIVTHGGLRFTLICTPRTCFLAQCSERLVARETSALASIYCCPCCRGMAGLGEGCLVSLVRGERSRALAGSSCSKKSFQLPACLRNLSIICYLNSMSGSDHILVSALEG